MPPGKRRQSNAMLYTLITFVALFVAATTVAVIYYVKAEELRTTAKDAQEDLADMASDDEIRDVGRIVGTRLRGETNLGSMTQYFDRMDGLVMGTPVAETSAEAKVATIKDETIKLLKGVKPYIDLPAGDPCSTDPTIPDPNEVPVMTVAADLLSALEQETAKTDSLTNDLAKLQQQFDDATAKWTTTEEDLTAKVDDYKNQVEQIRSDYAELRTLVEQSSEQRAANLLKQVEDLRAESRQLNDELLKTQAELGVAQQRLADALEAIKKTQPDPNERAVASKPDGKIILVDDSAKIVHINLGSDDQIYRGLTFSVYDRASGVSADDTPKAEIEVFAITDKTAAARILSSERTNPIAMGDIVANLIWEADKSNEFVIVGSFDLDGDGAADFEAKDRLTVLIEKWGGTVADTVSAKTDFVILGTEPTVPQEPTFEQLTADPEARTRFERAQARATQYETILQKAQTFYIPTLTYDRFLYLIGYQTQIGQPGAI